MTNEETEKKNFDSNASKGSKDSNSSPQSSDTLKVDDILEATNIVIKQDKPIKILKIFSESKFKSRFNIGKVRDLDFNFKKYKDFPINKDSEVDYSKFNQIWLQEMDKFYNEKGTNFELIIFGPKGIGKTISILA